MFKNVFNDFLRTLTRQGYDQHAQTLGADVERRKLTEEQLGEMVTDFARAFRPVYEATKPTVYVYTGEADSAKPAEPEPVQPSAAAAVGIL